MRPFAVVTAAACRCVLPCVQIQFAEMSINQPQTGVDDSPDIPAELFDVDRSRTAHALSSALHGSPAAAQVFQHTELWPRVCGVVVSAHSLYTCWRAPVQKRSARKA